MAKTTGISDFAVLIHLPWWALLLVLLATAPVLCRADNSIAYGQESSPTAFHSGSLVQDAATLMASVKALPRSKAVAIVNHFINERIRYEADLTLYGQPEYWATPQETLNREAGDCEDIAIVKYSMLLKAGIPPDELRFMTVRLEDSRRFHMILLWVHDGRMNVLDNTSNVISDLQDRIDLVPIYSFNEFQLWIGTNRLDAGNATRLSKWNQMVARWR